MVEQSGQAERAHRHSRRSHGFEHTLHGISEAFERGLFAEAISVQPGLFQSIDARVKAIATLALLVGVGMARQLWVIAAVYLVVLGLALASAIPAGFFIKRVWLALPFFTGVVILPALFLTPGPAWATLPLGLTITTSGINTVLFMLMRVSTSVSLTLLLILTTPWNTVLSALSVLRVPDVFILILGMTYRYIYLLLRSANDMFVARQSRVVGHITGADERRLIAATGGTLLNKSLNLSSEVYLAMQSRGFRGTVVTLKPFKMTGKDWLWLMVFLGLAAGSIILGR